MDITEGANTHLFEKFSLEYFLKINKKSEKLIVFSPGFLDGSKYQYPYFQRLKWSERISDNCLFLSDPTTLIGMTKIGWFVGDKETYYLPYIPDLIEKIAEKLGILKNDILFFGSSAGGFSSIAFASYLRGARAFAINPQTNALKLHDAQQLANTLKSCFGTASLVYANDIYCNRLNLINIFKETKNVPSITIWQNFYDYYHYREHLIPFLTSLSSFSDISKINVIIANEPEMGHAPPDLEKIKHLLWS